MGNAEKLEKFEQVRSDFKAWSDDDLVSWAGTLVGTLVGHEQFTQAAIVAELADRYERRLRLERDRAIKAQKMWPTVVSKDRMPFDAGPGKCGL